MVDTSDVKAKKRKTGPTASLEGSHGEVDMDTSEPAVAAMKESNAARDVGQEDEVDVEVLSHAEQRKRRKLEKAKALSKGVDGVDVEESEEAVAAGTSSSSKDNTTEPAKHSRSTYGIWVGNLSFKTDADKVCKLFSILVILQILTLHAFLLADRPNLLDNCTPPLPIHAIGTTASSIYSSEPSSALAEILRESIYPKALDSSRTKVSPTSTLTPVKHSKKL